MTRCHEGVAWWWHSPLAALHPQGFTDQRHGDVMVVRPMRDYTAKEIAFYNFFYSVPTVIMPPLFTKVGGVPWWGAHALCPHGRDRSPQSCPCWFPQRREKLSIHQLVERFLLGLQEEFPSTISTVYRYGGSLWGCWGCGGIAVHPQPLFWLQDRGETEPRASQGHQ